MEKYNRYDMETDEELIYRICSNKDKIGSWQDVADILNELLGTEFTESKFRKQFQAFEKMLEANKGKFLDDDNYLKEITLQKRELAKEKQKLSDERVEFNRLIREEARKESFEDLIKRVIGESVEPIKIEANEIKSYTSNNDLLVHLTDIHTGIVTGKQIGRAHV